MADTKENNILVIGNGFDLYHGLNTRYIDFVEFTKCQIDNNPFIDEICKSNPFIKFFQVVADANDGWIDCEDAIKYVVDLLSYIISDEELRKRGIQLSHFSNKEQAIFYSFDRYFKNPFRPQGFAFIDEKFKDGFSLFDTNQFISEMKKDLDNVIIVLDYYLTQCMNDMSNCTNSKQICDINPSYIVNFNYTDTVCRLYDVPEEDVFYIHGKLNANPNNMVFGIPDEEEESLDFVYFKKYFQRIQKRTGLLDDSRFHDNGFWEEQATTHFFGHSLSTTDGDIIQKIRSLSKKMIIYYRSQKDYEIKVINLINIFGKEHAVEMIQTKFVEFVEIEPKELKV